MPALQQKATGRNDPCPCGSGLKYKKCCISKIKQTAKSGVGTKRINLLQEATLFFRNGNYQKATEIAQLLLSDNHNDPAALHLLGSNLMKTGQTEQAEDILKKAAINDGNNPQVFNSLGICLHELRKYEEACACYKKAVNLNPEFIDALNNLGVSLNELNKLDEAMKCYRQVIVINPSFSQSYENMGIVLAKQGKFEEALESYSKARSLAGLYPALCNNIYLSLNTLGRLPESLETLKQGLAISDIPISFKEKLQIGLCRVLRDYGNYEATIAEYNDFIKNFNSAGAKIELACLFPTIADSKEHIEKIRKDFLKKLDDLEKENLKISEPEKEVGIMPFYHAYHGLNNKKILEHLAEFYAKACPSLCYVSKAVEEKKNVEDKIKIGFVSSYFRNHVVNKAYSSFISNLGIDKKYETYCFATKQAVHNEKSRILADNVKEFVFVSESLRTARKQIEDFEPDVLVYLDIGMNLETYFLAFSRLAPIQILFGGHPDTSGLKTIDYFISMKAIETKNAQEHYTEKLVLLKNNVAVYPEIKFPGALKTKEELSFPDGNIYICPVMLHKIHPDMDRIFKKILERDEKAKIILFKSEVQNILHELLFERFGEIMAGEFLDRIKFMPFAKGISFFNALNAADALLDTIHFGMGTTAYLSFSVNAPFVTLPGEFMRTRAGYWLYGKMGVEGLCAKDEDEYIDIALRLANDREFHKEKSEEIKNKKHVIYEDNNVMEEFKEFIENAISDNRKK